MRKLFCAFLMMTSILSAGQQEIDAVYQLYELCDKAMNEGDKETLLNVTTDDCIRQLPGRPNLYGKESFRGTLDAYFERVSVENSKAIIDEIRIADGWAFVRARWSGTLTSKVDGVVNHVTGKGMYVLECQLDGSYKISRTSVSYDK